MEDLEIQCKPIKIMVGEDKMIIIIKLISKQLVQEVVGDQIQ